MSNDTKIGYFELLQSLYHQPDQLSPVQQELKREVYVLFNKLNLLKDQQKTNISALENSTDGFSRICLKLQKQAIDGNLKLVQSQLRFTIMELKVDNLQRQNAFLKRDLRGKQLEIDQLKAAVRQLQQALQQQQREQIQEESFYHDDQDDGEDDEMEDLVSAEARAVSNNPTMEDADMDWFAPVFQR